MDKEEYEALLALSRSQFTSNASAKSGIRVSAETRAKLSASGKGRVITAETRAKLSASGKARRSSDETRLKIKLNNGRARKVNTPIGIFNSLTEAAKAHNKSTNTLGSWIRKKYDGFYFLD